MSVAKSQIDTESNEVNDIFGNKGNRGEIFGELFLPQVITLRGFGAPNRQLESHGAPK